MKLKFEVIDTGKKKKLFRNYANYMQLLEMKNIKIRVELAWDWIFVWLAD